jgi:hypothetical protein
MDVLGPLFWFVIVVAAVVIVWRARKRGPRGRVGAGAAGTIYDLLNQDKRNAIEIIVEERAEARDPEDADGNLPDLAGGGRVRIPPPRPRDGPEGS